MPYNVPQAAESDSGGRFLFGLPGSGIAHRAINDIVDMTVRAPTGLKMMAAGLYNDPLATLAQIPKGIAEDLQHPLRHPIYSLADAALVLGGAGSVAGRVAEAGRVAAAAGLTGEEAAAAQAALRPTITQALLRGPKPRERILRLPPTESTKLLAKGQTGEEPLITASFGSFTKNPGMQVLQKARDQLGETYPNLHVPGLMRSQAARISKSQFADSVMIRRSVRDLPARFVAKYKDLPLDQFVAGRVVAEGVPIGTRIEKHTEWANTAKMPPRLAQENRQQVKLLKEAQKYVVDTPVTSPDGVGYVLPKVKPGLPESAKLQAFVDDARAMSLKREQALIASGMLINPQHPRDAEIIAQHGYIPEGTMTASAINRRLGPYNVFHGNVLSEPPQSIEAQLNRQVALDRGREPSPRQVELRTRLAHYEPTGVQDPWLAEQTFRMPFKIEPGSRALIEGGSRYTGAEPQRPGTLTHPFKGGILMHGSGRLDLAHVIAEDYLESERFLYFKAMRDRLEHAAVDNPSLIDPKYRQAIRVRTGPEAPTYLKLANDLLKKPVEEMTDRDKMAGAKLFERARQWLLPEEDIPAGTPGIKYIDKRLLGGIDKANPLLSAFDFPGVRPVLNFFDALNEGNKAAILYAKPSYALPNLLGNVGLNLLQQGFFAPANLYRSTVAIRKYSPDVRQGILTQMGGGVARVLTPEARLPLSFGNIRNIVHKWSGKAAAGYGWLIDDPFRYSSFLHEAGDAGINIKSNEALRDLLQNPDRQHELALITKRANDAIIDYERLGPGEQSILRRMIFFYPWVKGSTRYSYQFVMAHPVATGLSAQAGKQAREAQENIFGELPAWAESLIPFGKPDSRGLVTTINPSSVAIAQTAGTTLEQIANLVSSPTNADLNLWQDLAPSAKAQLGLVTGGLLQHDKYSRTHSPVEVALHNILQSLPPYRLYDYLANRQGYQPTHAYPADTLKGTLLKYFLTGGLQPRKYDPAIGQYQAYLASQGR